MAYAQIFAFLKEEIYLASTRPRQRVQRFLLTWGDPALAETLRAPSRKLAPSYGSHVIGPLSMGGFNGTDAGLAVIPNDAYSYCRSRYKPPRLT